MSIVYFTEICDRRYYTCQHWWHSYSECLRCLKMYMPALAIQTLSIIAAVPGQIFNYNSFDTFYWG